MLIMSYKVPTKGNDNNSINTELMCSRKYYNLMSTEEKAIKYAGVVRHAAC